MEFLFPIYSPHHSDLSLSTTEMGISQRKLELGVGHESELWGSVDGLLETFYGLLGDLLLLDIYTFISILKDYLKLDDAVDISTMTKTVIKTVGLCILRDLFIRFWQVVFSKNFHRKLKHISVQYLLLLSSASPENPPPFLMAAQIRSSLFKPALPRQPVAMLMLIENSQTMSYIWPNLQDQCLDQLIDILVAANPSAPIPGTDDSLPRRYNGYHDGLRGVVFNSNPENRISPGRINSCIDFLDSIKFQGQPAALHLTIVSATAPSNCDGGVRFWGNSYSPWTFLAQKMAEGNIEEKSFLPVDPSSLVLRLSTTPNHEVYLHASYSDSHIAQPPQRRDTPLRNAHSLETLSSESFGRAHPPTSHVPQVRPGYRLIRPKPSSTKPLHHPRDKREKYRKAYTPSPMSSPAMAGQSPSASAIHRRSHGFPRRRTDSLPWPASPFLKFQDTPPESSSVSLPVTPTTSYMPSNIATSVYGGSPATPTYQTGGRLESSWPHQQEQPNEGAYTPAQQRYFSPRPLRPQPQEPQFYLGNTVEFEKNSPPPQQEQYLPLPPSSSYKAISPALLASAPSEESSMRTTQDSYPVSTTGTNYTSGPAHRSGSLIPHTRAPVAALATPVSQPYQGHFTFGKEFVVSTAALVEKEVPPCHPNYREMSSGVSTGRVQQANLPATAAPQTGELYAPSVMEIHRQSQLPLADTDRCFSTLSYAAAT
ncbi:hypothetical protein BDZ97DRAFT_2015371 [Flammula alnicola]|nr:hypothetical protein BDZ97DRAFT_2015371 [Flammula alnicola]